MTVLVLIAFPVASAVDALAQQLRHTPGQQFEIRTATSIDELRQIASTVAESSMLRAVAILSKPWTGETRTVDGSPPAAPAAWIPRHYTVPPPPWRETLGDELDRCGFETIPVEEFDWSEFSFTPPADQPLNGTPRNRAEKRAPLQHVSRVQEICDQLLELVSGR